VVVVPADRSVDKSLDEVDFPAAGPSGDESGRRAELHRGRRESFGEPANEIVFRARTASMTARLAQSV